jgi:hypothetical protein
VSELFEQAADAKTEQRAQLYAALTGAPAAEAEPTARGRLLELLGEDELARVDERLLALLTSGEPEPAEPEPEPGFFTQAAAAQETQRHAFVNALLGRSQPQPARDEQGRFASFDGGARATPPSPPQTHEEWLIGFLGTHPIDRAGRYTPAR